MIVEIIDNITSYSAVPCHTYRPDLIVDCGQVFVSPGSNHNCFFLLGVMSSDKSPRSVSFAEEEPQRYEQAIVEADLVTSMIAGVIRSDDIKMYDWKEVVASNKGCIKRNLEEGIYVNVTGVGFSQHHFYFAGEVWALGLQHMCFLHKKDDVNVGVLVRPIPKGCKVYQLLVSLKSADTWQADFVNLAGETTASLEFTTSKPWTVALVKRYLKIHLFKQRDISLFVPVKLVHDSGSAPLGGGVKLWDPSWDAPRCGGGAVSSRATRNQPGQQPIKAYMKVRKTHQK